jgi:hypothetical protein
METATLYRQLMKAAQNWPLDTARKSRDLGVHIRRRLAYDFRHAVVESDAERRKLLENGRLELAAIQKLTSNFYKNKVWPLARPGHRPTLPSVPLV